MEIAWLELDQPHASTLPPTHPQALEARLTAAREAHDAAVGALEACCSELEAEVRWGAPPPRRARGGPRRARARRWEPAACDLLTTSPRALAHACHAAHITMHTSPCE